MKKIIFTYDAELSKRHQQFFIRLAMAEKHADGWKIDFRSLARHGADLIYLANRMADRVQFKTALESELELRKLETRSLVDPDSFLLLRIKSDLLMEFVTRCQDRGILADRRGKRTAFKLMGNVVPDLVVQNGRLELMIEGKNFSAKDYILTFPPVTLVFKSIIFQLNINIAYPFIEEMPLGKEISEHQRDFLFRKYFQHTDKVRICLPDRKKIVKGKTPTPILNFDPALRRAQLDFSYDSVLIRDTEPQKVFVDDKKKIEVHRDLNVETQLRDFLKKEGFFLRPREHFNWFLSSRTLVSIYTRLVQKGVDIRVDKHKLLAPPEVKWCISADQQNIRVRGIVISGKLQLPADAMFKAFHRNRDYFKISNGSYGLISAEVKDRLLNLAKIGVPERDGLRFRRSDFAYIDQCLKVEDKVDVDASYTDLQAFARRFEGIDRYDLPDALKGVLRDYQILGFNWLRTLRDLGLNGILSDDMGLGKTLQVLALIESLREAGILPSSILLIVPKTLIFNWEAEIEKFTPKLSYLIYTGADRCGDTVAANKDQLVIASYGQVRQHIDTFCGITWDYVILDEAQVIKNPNAKISKAVKRIKSRHRLCLTGTPVENSALDLWSQFDFLMPGFLYGQQKFQRRYTQGEKNLQMLQIKTKPYILRRLKKQVAGELPDKTEITLFCDFTQEQKQVYDGALAQAREIINSSDNESSLDILQLILRLRQISCHPALALKEKCKTLTSGKLERIIYSGREILSEGHKILIFSQFTHHLRLVQNAFTKLKVTSFYLDGKTRDRALVIDRFKSHNGPCLFFISLKTGGTGLNLSEADHVFLLDPWWNPAVENQAIDRCHRIGQTQPVFVMRFITKDSIEEKVNDLKAMKQKIERAVIDASEPEYLAADRTFPDKDTMKQLICG